MPNGGVPINMALFPQDGAFVVFCDGGRVQFFARDAWDRDLTKAKPLCVLSEAEAGALAWFLRYWLKDAALQPPNRARGRVNAEFDFWDTDLDQPSTDR